MVTLTDYAGMATAWCPGCGNFGILNAFKKAMVDLGLDPHDILMVSGIGQAGKLPHYTKGNVLNMLHGRTLPAAAAAKMANNELVVVAIGGDGDGYGEGGNHFLHAMRRNHDITYLVHNNQIYGLTKGQASPTSDTGFVTRTTPAGSAPMFNTLAAAIVIGASFVARGFAGEVEHLAELIKKGVQHKGFALIDILQPCVSFNHKNTFAWYKQRVYKLEDVEGYDPSNKPEALSRAQEWGEKIPVGVIFRQDMPTFEQQLPVLKKGPLTKQKRDYQQLEALINEFY